MHIKNKSVKTPRRLKEQNRIAGIVWIAVFLAAVLFGIQTEKSMERSFSRLGYSILISTALADDDDEKERKREEKRRKKEEKQARKEEEKRLKEERKEEEKRVEREREEAEKLSEREEEENDRERDDDSDEQHANSGDDDDQKEQLADSDDDNNNDSEEGRSDNDGDNDGDKDDDKDQHADEDLKDDEYKKPPKTVAELIKRMIKPKRKKRRYGGGFSLGQPTFSQNEVLATNLSAGSIKRAERLGFKVTKGAHLSSLGLIITRLVAPDGMNARRARRMLHLEMPKDSFTLNQYYRIHPASRNAPGKNHTKASRLQHSGRIKCQGDHCYAKTVMKWRPQFRSCAQHVKIGLIDTPIDHEHPAFRGGRVQIGKFIPPGRKAASKWHGTGVLALLNGNSDTTTPGLIPGSEFYVANAFFADKTGTPVADSVSMLNALDWMDAFSVNVVNLSVAGPKDPLVQKAITKLSKKGMIFIAAAGNNGPAAPPSYPAAYRQVIAVTAVNKKLRGYRYANRGAYIDVAAPGVDIWTAMPERREGYLSGTSFAVPYVTAVIAAIYQQTAGRSKEQLLNGLRIRDLGNPGRDKVYGRGLVMAPKHCRPDPTKPHSIARASAHGR